MQRKCLDRLNVPDSLCLFFSEPNVELSAIASDDKYMTTNHATKKLGKDIDTARP